jgi:hypothetical protein
MSRDEVIWRHALWNEKEYHHYKKLGKAQLVNALLKTARTGEI